MKKYFLIAVFASFLFNNLSGQKVVSLSKQSTPEQIGNKFVYYMDETNALTINNILNSGKFTPPKTDVVNLNVFYGTNWSLAKFTCKENADYYFSLEPCAYTSVQVFQKKNNENWTNEVQYRRLEENNRRIVSNHTLFKIHINAADTVTLLLRNHDYMPTQLILKSGTLQSFIEIFHREDFFYCFVFGIIFTMLLYNFYLFVTQKQLVYFSYSIYAFSSLLFFFQTSGNANHLPGFLYWLLEICPAAPPALLAFSALFFTLQLFKNKLPKLLVKIMWGAIVFALTPILVYFIGYKREAFLILQPVALIYVILTLTTGLIAFRRKLDSVKFYLFGFGTYGAFFLYFLTEVVGLVAFNDNAFKMLSTGLTIEVIMLSFAVGDKMKSFLQQKEKAQEESLKQSRENERIVKEQNIILEEKVAERTKQFKEQKEIAEEQQKIVEEKQKEIIDSITYASRIQRALITSEKYFARKLNELKM